MVDDWNPAAIGVYERLGFTRHRIAAAVAVVGGAVTLPRHSHLVDLEDAVAQLPADQ